MTRKTFLSILQEHATVDYDITSTFLSATMFRDTCKRSNNRHLAIRVSVFSAATSRIIPLQEGRAKKNG